MAEFSPINYSQKYGFDHTIVRFHNIYGPNMGHEHVMPQLIRKLVKNEEFILEGDGTETGQNSIKLNHQIISPSYLWLEYWLNLIKYNVDQL